MKINYNNVNKKFLFAYEDILNKAFNQTIKELNLLKEVEINFTLVNKKEIKQINNTQRGLNEVTDVLSFPTLNLTKHTASLSEELTIEKYKNDINKSTGNLLLGDIVLCMPVVKKHAREYTNSLSREVSYMFVHSLLHLLGFNHLKESDKKKMRAKEEKILSNM